MKVQLQLRPLFRKVNLLRIIPADPVREIITKERLSAPVSGVWVGDLPFAAILLAVNRLRVGVGVSLGLVLTSASILTVGIGLIPGKIPETLVLMPAESF